MRKRFTILTAALVLLASLPASGQDANDGKPEVKRRVVTVITDDDVLDEIEEQRLEGGPGFVFVGPKGKLTASTAFLFRGGYLGVQLTDLTRELRRHFGVSEDTGVMISAVSEDGPAARAGVRVGDIVTGLDGEAVKSSGDLARLVRAGEEGKVVELEVYRDRRRQVLEVTLAQRDRPQIDVGQFMWDPDNDENLKALEMRLEELPEHVIRIDTEHIAKMVDRIRERLESGDLERPILSMIEERKLMEERIHELEDRLRELEKRLSKLDD